MLLSIKTNHYPATDLGYLLHKNPQKYHEFSLSSGKAHVFFSSIEEDSCCATLMLEMDPIGLVRKNTNQSFSLEQYVNNRPYVASSFLSIALVKVFRSAMKGSCKDRPELPNTPMYFEVTIAALPCKSENGKVLLKDLFEPLGYEVDVQEHLLDDKHPEWGNAQHYTVTIRNTCLLKDLLSHIYVLIPVLDNEKHYWITKDEVDKLLSYGEGWLQSHPKQELIVARYLKRQKPLTSEALGRLLDENAIETTQEEEEVQLEEKLTLHQERMQDVLNVLKKGRARRVADLGCGEGILLKHLLADISIEKILGMDVSYRSLQRAKLKLNLEELPPMQQERIALIQGSLNYTDARIQGYDAITLIEVIEHLDPSRLSTLEYVVFGFAQPKMVIITTPNSEYNASFESLQSGSFRHDDHRFEWSRTEFQSWAGQIAKDYGYTVDFQPVGSEDAKLGSPTQMGIFTKQESDYGKR
ncbi:MAG: 3' terminal RNA ribose 2'-O-methyltransferase Hen1 [Simkaniaceae bacterium]|nr:3' terminal RNA ribose 2'-O-methyltransferase Hen1 [Candidatus Sacchlamyda saccharinae]